MNITKNIVTFLTHSSVSANKSVQMKTLESMLKALNVHTWDLLKETTFGDKSFNNISEINANGELKSTPKDISEEFNNFFTNIGQSISNNVTPTLTNPESYINDFDPSKAKFNLGNTLQIHVMDIIKSFESKASLDIDGVSLKLIKFVDYEVSLPLSHIFNLSL